MIRRRTAAWVMGLVIAVGVALLPAAPSSAVLLFPREDNRRCAWPIVYPGKANYAYPDTSAAYFVQAALIGPGEEIVITGRDPRARYWSLQTYRFSDSTLLDSVNDVTVKRTGQGSKRSWTVRVVAEGRDDGTNPNVLEGTGEFDGVNFGSNITVVMMRVYVSRTATAWGGPIPKVTLMHLENGRKRAEVLAPCTGRQVGAPENRPSLDPAVGMDFDFRRGPAERFYPSADTAYLVAEAAYRRDEILVMTGRAPRSPQDVRYWSICQNVNAGLLPVVDCLRDDEIAVDDSGHYTVAVVGPRQVSAADRARYPGVSFLTWTARKKGAIPPAFLIYRNILSAPGFAGAADKVTPGEIAAPVIGDYAPVLRYVPKAEFEALYGPVPEPS